MPLHGVDPGEICRHEMIATALSRHHLEATAPEGPGGFRAAEVNESGEILFLLLACCRAGRGGENASDIAIQVYSRELDGVSWYHSDIEAVEPAIDAHNGALGCELLATLVRTEIVSPRRSQR